jgi:hypothetical protein
MIPHEKPILENRRRCVPCHPGRLGVEFIPMVNPNNGMVWAAYRFNKITGTVHVHAVAPGTGKARGWQNVREMAPPAPDEKKESILDWYDKKQTEKK